MKAWGTPATKNDTRENILRATQRVFIAEAYSRLTLRKIAPAADVSLSSLNDHFRREDALLTALLERIIERYLIEFDRHRIAAGQSPDKPLEAVLEFWMDDLCGA